ncbi:MAG: glycosyl hydrolase family 18 protein [Bacilli bacterium]
MKKNMYFLFVLLLLILTGCKTKNIEVTFDSDGGSLIESITLNEASTITKPLDPIKDGYMFMGWSNNDQDFDFSLTISESITLKAIWEEAVTVFLSYSSDDIRPVTVLKGATYSLPEVTKEGYTFLGWYNTQTGEEVTDDYIYTDSLMIEPKFEKRERYKFVYYYNDAVVYSDYVYLGDEYTPYVLEINGYHFMGYFLNSDLSSEFDFDDLSRTNYIYVQMAQNEYNVTFDVSGTSKTVLYNSAFGDLPMSSIKGCSVLGWYFEGEEINASTIYTYEENITLTPKLQVYSKFYLTADEYVVKPYYIGDYIPEVNTYKEGYTFAGWYINSNFDGNAMYYIDDIDDAGNDFYGLWIEEDDEYANQLASLVINYYISLYDATTISSDLLLPSQDPFYNCNLTWTSDNTRVLNNTGKINRSKDDTDVHMTLTVLCNDITQTATFTITIDGAQFADLSDGGVVTAYVYTGSNSYHPVDDILMNTADIINLAFSSLQEDGSVDIKQTNIDIIEKNQVVAEERGLRFVMCVGGSDSASVFSHVAADATLRGRFVNNVIDLIKEYNLGGVDIDWEYPYSGADTTNYILLLQDLYRAVKAYDSDCIVTSAIPGGPWGYPRFNLGEAVNYLDYINMMTYDMNSMEVPGYHQSALYSSSRTLSQCSVDSSVEIYINEGVPYNKIVIGAAFYARTGENGTIKYSTVVSEYLNNGYTEKWDSTAHAAYIEEDGVFLTYDSPRAIVDKCTYVNEYNLGGIMFWDYGSGNGDLIESLNSCLGILKNN